MSCFSPLPAWRVRSSGEILIGRKTDWREGRTDNRFAEALSVPCSTCVGCRAARARDWAIRCSLELGFHREAVWSTLTYDERHLPPTLQKAHLSGFLKRLRARLGTGIRFFACGEYGERTWRPHYHAILFGVSDVPQIQASWPYGYVKNGSVTPQSIAYTAGYAAKKLGVVDEAEERIDYTTGEVYRYQPPFLLMSRRPGIGGDARQFTGSWRKKAMFGGLEVPVPRFLHEAWKAHASPSEIEALREEKRIESLERQVTFYSLKAGRRIAESRRLLSSARRSL